MSNPTSAHEQLHRKKLIAHMKELGQTASTETALFHHAAASKYGLGITDMKLISSLIQEGPMTAGQIATRLSLTTGAVTNVIDRLEGRCIVSRKPHPKDGRKIIVAVNYDVLDHKKNVYSSMGRAFAKMLSHYSTAELEFLTHYYEQTIELTKKEIAKLQQFTHDTIKKK